MSKSQKRSKNFGKGNWRSYFKLIPYIHLPWFLIFIAFIVDMFHSEIMSYVPVSTSALFSGEFTGAALTSAIIYNVLNYGLMFGSMIVMSTVSYYAVRRSQQLMWGRMLRVKMEYYDTHNPSNLMSALTNDTDQAVTALISQMVSLIPSFYYLYKVAITLNSYDYRLLLSILIVIPIEVLYTVIMGRWRYETISGINGSIGKLTAHLAERVSNMSLIRAFTNEAQEEKNGLDATKGLYDAKIRNAKVGFVSDTASIIMELLQRGMPIVFGMILLQSKAINMQQWIAFFLFTGQINSKITSVLGLWTGFKSAQGSAARMVEIFDAQQENYEEGKEEKVQDGDICLKDITFAYGDKEVLHNVTCSIPQGKTTALVGRSGSGKTTLLSLIELFPNTTKLMITHDLRMLSQVDHVIFMQNGCVCDSGSHIELMSRCEAYRDLALHCASGWQRHAGSGRWSFQ